MSDSLQIATAADGVVSLTLNRPHIHNAFDDDLVLSLTDALQRLNADDSVRALVLSGNGASFSAGADLAWMQSMVTAGKQENKADALQLAALMRSLNYFSKPTIARINGAAFGGGVGLIACCDIAIAADTAVLGLTEVHLGLAPAVISPYVFRKIGERQARRYFINGERFSAARAKELGLVHEVTAFEDLDQAVERQLKLIAKAGPLAARYAKQLSFAIAGHDADKQQELDQMTASLIAELRVSREGQEGLQAFLEKRKPDWVL